MSKQFHRPSTGDTVTVPDVLAAKYLADKRWELVEREAPAEPDAAPAAEQAPADPPTSDPADQQPEGVQPPADPTTTDTGDAGKGKTR